MLDQILRDMESNIQLARGQVASMIAQEKELQADLKEVQDLSSEWQTKASRAVEAGKAGAWDIAFVALDPARAAEIAQSPPYVQIEGAYLVRNESPLQSNDEVDRKGHRVVVGRNSAYDDTNAAGTAVTNSFAGTSRT